MSMVPPSRRPERRPHSTRKYLEAGRQIRRGMLRFTVIGSLVMAALGALISTGYASNSDWRHLVWILPLAFVLFMLVFWAMDRAQDSMIQQVRISRIAQAEERRRMRRERLERRKRGELPSQIEARLQKGDYRLGPDGEIIFNKDKGHGKPVNSARLASADDPDEDDSALAGKERAKARAKAKNAAD